MNNAVHLNCSDQKLATKLVDEYRSTGFILLKDYFDPNSIRQIWSEAKLVFSLQMEKLGIFSLKNLEDDQAFSQAMFLLFKKDTEAFVNCGKQVQHLISLHKLSLSEKILLTLKNLNLEFPNISTRPVMYFNHPNLAQEKIYHTVFPHQDWRSMQGSLDSVVVWLPLVDIDKTLGALEVIPKSHKWGLVTDSIEYGFGKVELSQENVDKFHSIEVERGDALFFSSFLVHRSGNIETEKIRWSAHFRYNNLLEAKFIDRKFAHPYIYRPQTELITDNFPSSNEINDIFS